MGNKILEAELNEIKDGYILDSEQGTYQCLFCGEEYEVGRIYSVEDNFYEAYRAIKEHIRIVHNGVLDNLLSYDKKHTGLTEKQQNLLRDISNGLTYDNIARKNEISPSTVRYHKFMLSEKAKQAKLFIAIFQLVEESAESRPKEKLLKPHSGATMLDERYILNYEEQEKILKTYFEEEDDLKLKSFPAKEKRKIVVLRKIATQFKKNSKYTEKEVNEILKPIYKDIATIRRYLIEYGFLDRTKDCKSYWLKEK